MNLKEEKLIAGKSSSYLTDDDGMKSVNRLGFIIGIATACLIVVGQLAIQIITAIVTKGTDVYDPGWMGVMSIFFALFMGKDGQKWIELHSTKIGK